MIRSEDVRDKLRPMIDELFFKNEREIILQTIAKEVAFIVRMTGKMSICISETRKNAGESWIKNEQKT